MLNGNYFPLSNWLIFDENNLRIVKDVIVGKITTTQLCLNGVCISSWPEVNQENGNTSENYYSYIYSIKPYYDYDGDGVIGFKLDSQNRLVAVDCDDTNASIKNALDGSCDGDGDGCIDYTAGGNDCDDNDASVCERCNKPKPKPKPKLCKNECFPNTCKTSTGLTISRPSYKCKGNVLYRLACSKTFDSDPCYDIKYFYFKDCSKYDATCSNKEGKCVIGSPPQTLKEIYPTWADVSKCTNICGKTYSTTGKGYATWFVWNGCAREKKYNVEPGSKLILKISTDAGSCFYPRFRIQEYANNKLIKTSTISLPNYKKFVWWKTYNVGSKTTSIKIIADNCFYLKVFKAS